MVSPPNLKRKESTRSRLTQRERNEINARRPPQVANSLNNSVNSVNIALPSLEPPNAGQIRRHEPTARSRLTNNNIERNEYGIPKPLPKSENYEPHINNKALLVGPGYYYRNKAKANRNAAVEHYERNRQAAINAGQPTVISNTGTRRSLFGGKQRLGKRRLRRTRKSRV